MPSFVAKIDIFGLKFKEKSKKLNFRKTSPINPWTYNQGAYSRVITVIIRPKNSKLTVAHRLLRAPISVKPVIHVAADT